MELKDFISETLNQIIDGVKDAQEHAKGTGAAISPMAYGGEPGPELNGMPVKDIEFDVAVTATEGTKTKGGIGVFVGPVGLGTHGQSDTASSSISRIKFVVPLSLPEQQE